ncbi:unnamed protein product [Nippostrongylus brasiliensis]|uniref:Proliferating cell nuclear antigen (inferred by orthology to a C. elegans protein) n=1 Tax=Nippostrongylus brasiliensis TaxID=27835 RepID=A0A0N4XJ55_NIPBR|nr:unnamed protein product [Nippostrongylus brasiliensis]
MFEAKLANAALLKKIIEAIKDLVTDAPFDCSESAMCLQAMDSSHVALVSLKMEVIFLQACTVIPLRVILNSYLSITRKGLPFI